MIAFDDDLESTPGLSAPESCSASSGALLPVVAAADLDLDANEHEEEEGEEVEVVKPSWRNKVHEGGYTATANSTPAKALGLPKLRSVLVAKHAGAGKIVIPGGKIRKQGPGKLRGGKRRGSGGEGERDWTG
jgi:hypothetical protein